MKQRFSVILLLAFPALLTFDHSGFDPFDEIDFNAISGVNSLDSKYRWHIVVAPAEVRSRERSPGAFVLLQPGAQVKVLARYKSNGMLAFADSPLLRIAFSVTPGGPWLLGYVQSDSIARTEDFQELTATQPRQMSFAHGDYGYLIVFTGSGKVYRFSGSTDPEHDSDRQNLLAGCLRTDLSAQALDSCIAAGFFEGPLRLLRYNFVFITLHSEGVQDILVLQENGLMFDGAVEEWR